MANCKVCDEPLILQVDDEVGEMHSIPDDLELPCGCHFHWQCLLDQSPEVAISLKCPACQGQITSNTAGSSATNQFVLHATSGVSIKTRYINEGGIQDGFDILPSITEEAYLAANPQARPARAFQVMCSEGDVEGIVDLLRGTEQDDGEEPSMPINQLIRYQDPLADNKSGLHLAVEKGQQEVVWLLLWIASPLPTAVFPEAAVMAAQALGIQRPNTTHQDDIRDLQDSGGRTAETLATAGIWHDIVNAGLLYPGT